MIHFKVVSLLILCVGYASMALAADTPVDQKGIYLGAFGGLGALESTSLRQVGTVILT